MATRREEGEDSRGKGADGDPLLDSRPSAIGGPVPPRGLVRGMGAGMLTRGSARSPVETISPPREQEEKLEASRLSHGDAIWRRSSACPLRCLLQEKIGNGSYHPPGAKPFPGLARCPEGAFPAVSRGNPREAAVKALIPSEHREPGCWRPCCAKLQQRQSQPPLAAVSACQHRDGS